MSLPYATEEPSVVQGHVVHEEHEGLPGTIGHVSSWKSLVKVLSALIFLTVLTVAVAQLDLGRLNVVGALGIACVKASIVALWFMHLRYDKRFNFWIFISSVAFVAWMVGYILFDSTLYQHNIKEYRETHEITAPKIHEHDGGEGHESGE
ncbi:MAG: cytochrome C oxidase subunit IV family protein [Planctomycetes bacterium]|nr:cytochrome C oxidase subunit IV family protein [Planctomycetota bacterium]